MKLSTRPFMVEIKKQEAGDIAGDGLIVYSSR